MIGGGAWGTALAQVAAADGQPVTLWAREPEVVESINARHVNELFLSSVPLSVPSLPGSVSWVLGCVVVVAARPVVLVAAAVVVDDLAEVVVEPLAAAVVLVELESLPLLLPHPVAPRTRAAVPWDCECSLLLAAAVAAFILWRRNIRRFAAAHNAGYPP